MSYGLAGRKAEANKILNELLELNRHRYVTPPALANVYIGLGEKDQAFFWLEKAYQDRSNYLAYLKVFPGVRLAALRPAVRRPFAPPGARVINLELFRADGRELYYYTPERKLMSVEVNGSGSTFQVAPARPLFEIRVGGAGVDLGFPGGGYLRYVHLPAGYQKHRQKRPCFAD
jgi:tetratricopeptide (TPR) repeat protein